MLDASFHRQRARGFCIECFSGLYLRDFFGALPDQLYPYPYRGVCFIVEIDWLSRFRAMIDCEGQ